MRISDGSSDVCSSDLSWALSVTNNITAISNLSRQRRHEVRAAFGSPLFLSSGGREREGADAADRKSVVRGQRVTGCVALVGRLVTKQKRRRIVLICGLIPTETVRGMLSRYYTS